MLQEIAKVTGIPFYPRNQETEKYLRRIERLMPLRGNVSLMDHNFINAVRDCHAKVQLEDVEVARKLKLGIVDEPVAKKEKPKIKRSPKGERISVAAPNGIRYAYGPIWNASVAKGKGIALAEQNREKLYHQARMHNIKTPENMDVGDLVKAITKRLEKSNGN